MDHLVQIVTLNPGGFETYVDHDEALDRAFVHLEAKMMGGGNAEDHEGWPWLTWYLGADPEQVICHEATKVIP